AGEDEHGSLVVGTKKAGRRTTGGPLWVPSAYARRRRRVATRRPPPLSSRSRPPRPMAAPVFGALRPPVAAAAEGAVPVTGGMPAIGVAARPVRPTADAVRTPSCWPFWPSRSLTVPTAALAPLLAPLPPPAPTWRR